MRANLTPNRLGVDLFAVRNFSKTQAPWPCQSCSCSETHVTGNVRCVHTYYWVTSRIIGIPLEYRVLFVLKERFGNCGAGFKRG